ncbi:PREDICTED: uncharacterized protein K02A2.6-like [Rhagoletis zephyria]|uniref:uncharacterized protein K02A2.6-like n=1 Tax=Rhagoletis zephyria TaxID=28612 RepID=UPI0008115B8D|nr:PREDICTED: uncharacterized protein K02A2.6-like [Rhagoletis zephyria]
MTETGGADNSNLSLRYTNDSIMAALTTTTGIREFRPGVDSWRNWKELLDSHFIETACEDDKIKSSVLLKAVGLEAYGLLRDLCDPVLPATKEYSSLCSLLERHYSQPTIVFRERQTFFDAKKAAGENVAAWFARVKKLAKDCKFGGQLNAFVLNKFVNGFEGKIFEKLCEEEENLTLEQALRKAMVAETKMHVQRNESEVNFVSRRNQKSFNKSNANMAAVPENRNNNQKKAKKKCSHCGWKSHTSEKCKFKNSTCHKCGSVGHLASICSKRHVNLVEVSKLNEDNICIRETNSFKFVSDLSIYSIAKGQASSPFTLAVEVDNVPLSFVLDTGAACSLIPKVIYDKYFHQNELKACSENLSAYNGSQIDVAGEFMAMVKTRDQSHVLRLVVSNSCGPPILGRDFMKICGLGLSQINSLLEHQDIVEHIKTKYSEVFEEGLGAYTVNKVKLSLVEEVKPIFCKPRPVPQAWRDKIEKQITDLVNKGVLVQVDNSDWGTPLVPVVKPNGDLRICGDYKSTINKYLSDVRYPLPRIDELFASMQGQLFSKLDLSNAYNQLVLDEASQMLCAWSTHVGIFKMTRLPFGVKPAAAIFQKTIENILRGIPNVVNYLDDIVITGSDFSDHVKTIETVLTKLRAVGLRLNANRNGLTKNKDRVKSVVDAPVPQNVSENPGQPRATPNTQETPLQMAPELGL